MVDQPPPLPPFTDADVPEAVRLLTWSATTVAQGDPGSVADVDRRLAEQLAGATTEQLGAAIGLWHRLVGLTVTPEHAAAMPGAPFRGPDGGPWHSMALAQLPARVLLAGPDVVREVLAGAADALRPGLPDVPDVRRAAAWMVWDSVVGAAAEWARRTMRRRRAVKALSSLEPELDPRVRITTFWGPSTLADEWRIDAGWTPLAVVGPTEREAQLFGSVSSPLSFTSRYPTEVVGGSSRLAGSGTKAGSRVMALRSTWLGGLEALLQNWVEQLDHDIAGLAGPPEARLTTTLPSQRLTARPLASVTLRTGAGLSAGGLRGGHGLLPPLRGPFPVDAEATDSRTEQTDTEVQVHVDLPSRALPPLEDTVVGVLRVFAHRLLADVPDLTDHARQVLTTWRDHGPGAWGTPGATLATDVDDAVGFARTRGVELT